MVKGRVIVVTISLIIIFSILNPGLALTLGEKSLDPLDGGDDGQPQSTIEVKTLGRTKEPVVVFANQVPDLNGTPVSSIDVFSSDNNILVYEWDGANSTWKQIPFQVDERNPITGSWAVNYNNGVLDGMDEIVFMSGDAGDRASSNEWVRGCDAPRYEIEITDPDSGNSAWAYIYKSSTIEADFTEDYVSFNTSVNDIITDSYSMGFRDGIGMIMDYFNITEAYGGDGEDLVDTFEIEAKAQVLWIVQTYDENNLAADFTLKKDAHVRALGVVSWHIYQSTMGITVDAYLNFTWKFYPEHVAVAGHIQFEINGGVTVSMWLALDHISSAIPMDYRDDCGNTGIINGIDDDSITDPVVQNWWEVSSPHGGYVCVWDIFLESGSQGLKFDDDSGGQDHDNAEPGLYGRTGAYFDDIDHQQETYADFSFYPIPSDVSGVAESIMYNITNPLVITAAVQHSPLIWVEKSVDVHYAGSGYSQVWVNVPHIDANSDTDYIWMYYDNPDAADVQDESGTYDNNYIMVQHLNEKSGTHYDSTSYGNDGTEYIDTPGIQDATGKIDGADEFDGNNDYIDCGNDPSLNISETITLEVWAYMTEGSKDVTYNGIVHKYAGPGGYMISLVNSTKKARFWIRYNSSTYRSLYSDNAIDDGFHHLTLTLDSSGNMFAFVDGVKQSTANSGVELGTADTKKLEIGRYSSNYVDGTIDEVRISNIARSADWIKAQYLSMNSDFVTYGDEEVVTWKPSWSHRKKLTFDNSGQSEALVNFPVLVNLSLSNFDYSKAKLDGTDLRFVAADNVTELKYHIEDWDNGGDYAYYTLYFNNTGDRDANVVWINDTLPAEVTFLEHDADESSSSASFLTNFNQIGKTLHFKFQDVPQGVHYFNITVLLNPDVTLGETLTNWVFCNFTNLVGEKMPESSASASFDVLVTHIPDIQVVKSVDKATVLPGEILQYTIYFNNTGSGVAKTVWINETLPAEVTYLSDSSATELGVKTADHKWTFTNVAPGNHFFVINVSVGSAAVGTSIDNVVSLAYTDASGIGIPGSQAWANTTIAYYQILKQGWNLISIPLIQEEQNLISVLASIDGLYDAVQWYDITDTNDPWKHYKVGKPLGNDLSEINETMGFWVHITPPGDTIFMYNGNLPASNQIISLHSGWNHVGYPSLINRERDAALNNIIFGTEVDSVWTYNSTLQQWEELGPSDTFELGRGYWVHSIVEKTWDVPL